MVNSPSVVEISSWLQRADRQTESEKSIHHNWDPTVRATLVILWGLLIYPLLDPDLKREKREISIDFLRHLFQEYVGGDLRCREILNQLSEHDYIRFQENNIIVPGTRLFTAVDAARMYPLFRSSVLSRKLMKISKEKGS